MQERDAYIALNMIEGIGPVKVRAMMELLGSPQAVFSASTEVLQQARGIGAELARSIVAQRESLDVEAEHKKAAAAGCAVLTPLDEDYPAALKDIHDPPLALYVKGALDPKDRHALAIVGSRRCTHYGKTTADRLAYQLGKVGFTVVSGLARGIDTAAHEGALKAGARTLAVLGAAIDQLYPPESEDLAAAIAKSGALVSEYPMGKPPDRTTFPYRNRIIAGITKGTILVEAGLKSGALHTADAALEQGRSVFAVPGRIDSPASKGCHQLLKTGACLVRDVDDILEEFELLLPAGAEEGEPALQGSLPLTLGDDEQALVSVLVEGAVDVDTLTRRAGLDSSKVSSLLLGLEMKRVVRMLPGRVVELTVTPGNS